MIAAAVAAAGEQTPVHPENEIESSRRALFRLLFRLREAASTRQPVTCLAVFSKDHWGPPNHTDSDVSYTLRPFQTIATYRNKTEYKNILKLCVIFRFCCKKVKI